MSHSNSFNLIFINRMRELESNMERLRVKLVGMKMRKAIRDRDPEDERLFNDWSEPYCRIQEDIIANADEIVEYFKMSRAIPNYDRIAYLDMKRTFDAKQIEFEEMCHEIDIYK